MFVDKSCCSAHCCFLIELTPSRPPRLNNEYKGFIDHPGLGARKEGRKEGEREGGRPSSQDCPDPGL